MATKYEYQESITSEISTSYDFGQSFTVGTVGTNENFTLTSIKLKIQETTGAGTLYVSVYLADGSGYPTGEVLSSGSFNYTSSYNDYADITMSSYELVTSTKYCILLNPTTETLAVKIKDSDVYAGGTFIYSTGTWTSVPWDIYFQVYGEPAATGTNMQINIGDAWKPISAMQINIGDAWKPIASAKINIGDEWKTIF